MGTRLELNNRAKLKVSVLENVFSQKVQSSKPAIASSSSTRPVA